MSLKKTRRFFQLKRFWISLALLVGLGWLVQRPAITAVLEFAAEVACGRQGLVFSAESMQAGLFEPLVLEGVSIRVDERSGDSRSALDLERLQVDWQNLGEIFSNPRRLISKSVMTRMNVLLDFRRGENGVSGETAWRPVGVLSGLLCLAGEWPKGMEWVGARIEIETDSTRWVAERCDAVFDTNGPGRFGIGTLTVHAPRFERVFGPLEAGTAWDGTRLSLANMEILPGVLASEISCGLERGGDPTLSFQGRVFGGSVRGDWNFQRAERGTVWDFAAVCSNVALEAMPAVLGVDGKAQGRLAEGRFTFRGEPGRPTDAEASLRVLAKDFRWNDRGWESLEIGASLIHRRLLVSNFDLRQSENTVTLNGEISLAEGWGKLADAPFLGNLRANIKELGALARLTGGGAEEAKGRLVAEGSVSGRLGSLDGFVGVRANGIDYRGVRVDEVDVEVLFKKTIAEIVRCEMKSNGDALSAKGRIGQAAPYSYSAELEAKLADLTDWVRPFPKIGGGMVAGGAMKLNWSGDGSRAGHSGVFDLNLERFVSELTPAGLTGHFAGTYSPKNIYFSQAEMVNGPMRMRSRVTLSSSGINLDDLELQARGKDLLRGRAFLPVNPFTLRSVADWNSAVLESKDIYILADTPGELALRDLVRLAGQDWPIEGVLGMQIEAFGPASGIDGNLSLQARDVVWGGEKSTIPSDIQLNLRTTGGTAKLEGEMTNSAMSPLKLSASFPFGLFKDGEGVLRWVRRDGKVEAAVDFPRADLALLRPFFKTLGGLAGELSGELDFVGTLGAPKISGSAEIRNGAFQLGALAAPAQFVNGRLEIEDAALRIRDVAGEIEPGRFEFSGSCDFPTSWQPRWKVAWLGERIPLMRDGQATLLADVDVRGEGDASAGSLTGRIDLVDSKISSRVEATPFLSAPGAAEVDLRKSSGTLATLAPLPGWTLDVRVGGQPIVVEGGKFPAFLTLDLRLAGTPEKPVPGGRISWSGLEVGMPAGGDFFSEGELAFFPDKPWEPFVLAGIEGSVEGWPFAALAYGPLAEGKWVIRSAEPQAGFLLLREGLVLRPTPAETMGRVEFFIMNGSDRLVAIRIEDHTVVGDGMRFLDSMDYRLKGSILPAGSFRSGFQWRWTPVF